MKKYMAGGKTVGGNSSSVKEDCSQTNQAFSAMLANRDRQMADLWTTTAPPQSNQNKGQIVVHKPVTHAQNKSADIDMILNGDF